MAGTTFEPAPDAFETQLNQIAVATADQADPRIDRPVREMLRLIRDHLQMDVAFVSQLTAGRRVFRYVDTDEGRQVIGEGGSDPVEKSFCQQVIEGRMPELVVDVIQLPQFGRLPSTPFPIGSHLSTPIVLRDGTIYGTLCCFTFAPNEALTQRDLKRLRMAAEMTARLLDKRAGRATPATA